MHQHIEFLYIYVTCRLILLPISGMQLPGRKETVAATVSSVSSIASEVIVVPTRSSLGKIVHAYFAFQIDTAKVQI